MHTEEEKEGKHRRHLANSLVCCVSSSAASLPGGSSHCSLPHLHFDWVHNGFKPP